MAMVFISVASFGKNGNDATRSDIKDIMPTYPEFKHEKFRAKAPSFDKVVRVTSNGVNIRKQPSTQAPRLFRLYDLTEECLDCPPEVTWANKISPNKGEAATAYQEEVYPLLGESGDWYEIYIDVYAGTPLNTSAYINKKFCKIEATKPLALSAPECLTFAMVKSGKYAGLCVMCTIDEMEGNCLLQLGKYSEGMLLFPYSITVEQSNDNKIRLVNNDYSYLSVDESMFKSSDLGLMLNLDAFVSEDRFIDILMDNLNKMSNYSTTFYYGVAGDDDWKSIEIINPTWK